MILPTDTKTVYFKDNKNKVKVKVCLITGRILVYDDWFTNHGIIYPYTKDDADRGRAYNTGQLMAMDSQYGLTNKILAFINYHALNFRKDMIDPDYRINSGF